MRHKESALLPEEGAYISFQDFKILTKTSFIIYGDFKCVLIPSTDNIGFVPNTKKN